jgi:hypothetical protein
LIRSCSVPWKWRKLLPLLRQQQLFANVVSPFLVAGTATVWKADFEGVFVACFEVCYAGADGGDDLCWSMAERKRFMDLDVAVALVAAVVEVAAAEAGGGDADLELFCFGG